LAPSPIERVAKTAAILDVAYLKELQTELSGLARELTPQVVACSASYFEILRIGVSQGRLMLDQDEQQKKLICLIGENKNTTIIDGSAATHNGITIKNHDNVTVSGFTIRNVPTHPSQPFWYSNGIHIWGYAYISGDGHANYNTISDCILYNNSCNGIRITASDVGQSVKHNVISNCEIYKNGFCNHYSRYGIYIAADQDPGGYSYAQYNTIENCTIRDNFFGGIRLGHEGETSENLIKNCEIYNNSKDGIYLISNGQPSPFTHNNMIIECDIHNNTGYGVNITAIGGGPCNSNLIYHNNLDNGLSNANDECNNTWYNSTLQEGNYWGDFDEPSEGAYDNNSDGIVDSPYNIPGGSNQDRYPLINPLTSPPVFVWVDDDFDSSTPGWQYDHFNKIQDGIDAVAENGTVYTFNGTYYENVIVNKRINLIGEDRNGTIIDGGGSGDVVYISADWVNIRSLSTTNGGSHDGYDADAGLDIGASHCNVSDCDAYNNGLVGIQIRYSTDCDIYNCNVYNNYRGIRLRDSSYNHHIKNCIISDNKPSCGLEFGGGSESHIIENCQFINNGYGINFRGNSNYITIKNCAILNHTDTGGDFSGRGIRFTDSGHHNIITNCTLSNCNYGFYGASTNFHDNYIYHNNFINNAQNAYDVGNNIWDNDYPSGGNYWSDFDEPSEGAYDNNSDGIVDSPYYIPGGSNVDRYPLIRPYTGYYYDNFEDGTLNKWYIISGEWEVITEPSGNHIAHLKRSSEWGRILVSKEAIPDNVIIQANVKGDATGDVADTAVGFYSNDNGNSFYYVCLGSYNGNSLGILKVVNGIEHELIGNTSVITSNKVWYHVKIKLENTNIFAKIWEIGSVEPSHWQISYPGAIKFGNHIIIGGEAGQDDEEFWFDNISVKSIPSTVYVDDDFNAFTPGWDYDHFNKIQDGINAVTENGTVYVFNGTYYENVVINKIITLIGEDRNGTIIDAQGSKSPIRLIADDVTISHFTMTHSGESGNQYAGIDIDSNYNYIFDCNICNNSEKGILAWYTSHNIIEKCLVFNNDEQGIDLGYGNYFSKIINCSIWRNAEGIKSASPSANISIMNCTVFDNGGITLEGSYSKIKNCKIFNNTRGIRLRWGSCHDNIIENNVIEDNIEHGIVIIDGDNNIINNNTILSNIGYGIYADSSSFFNKIYHNNIVDNTIQSYDQGNNVWDDGYPSGGNYWSDFDEPSEGAYDNNSDGIVDSPYYIPGGSNVDHYPLMHPYGINVPPVANFSYSPLNPTDLETIAFTDSSSDSDGSIVNWTWNFGDGAVSYQRNPSHQYADDGIYLVNLTVTDDDGASDTIQKQITASNVPPLADFSWSPLNPTTADTIQFTDLSSDADGSIVSWSWEFGDGSTSTLQNPTHQYADDGTYNVTLTVTDDDGATDTITKQIVVSNVAPIADFDYSPPFPTTASLINFKDHSSDSDGYIVNYTWDFGDGNVSYLQNPHHRYPNAGKYVVILTVTDDDGATDSMSKNITVRVPSPPPHPPTPPKLPEPDVLIHFIGPHEWNLTHWEITPETLICFDMEVAERAGIVEMYYRIDNGSWMRFGYTGCFNLTLGEHYLYYFGIDKYGTCSNVACIVIEVVGSLAPLTTCSLDPAIPNGKNGWYIGNVTITLTAKDDISGVDSTYFKIDNDNWRKYTGEIKISEDGEYIMKFYSIDNYGNKEETKSVSVKIDKTKPTINFKKPTYGYLYLMGKEILPLKHTIIIGKAMVAIDGNDEISGINKVEFYVDGELKEVIAKEPYEWMWDEFVIGKHTIKAIAYDNAGNIAIDEQEVIIFNIG